MNYRKRTNKFAIRLILASGVTLLGLTGCSNAGGTQCDSKACFSEHFADCDAASFTTEQGNNAKVRYQIEQSGSDGCRLQMTFVKNPNPAWQGKSLGMVLDTDQSFESQMKSAVTACMMQDAPGAYQCSGELRGIAARP